MLLGGPHVARGPDVAQALKQLSNSFPGVSFSNILQAAFLYQRGWQNFSTTNTNLRFVLVIFCQKEIRTKAACKILVKCNFLGFCDAINIFEMHLDHKINCQRNVLSRSNNKYQGHCC